MATSTTIARRTIKVKNRPKRERLTMGPGPGVSGTRVRGDYAGQFVAKATPRPRKWWKKSEVLFAIATVAIVASGLVYLGLTATPNTGYPQDEYYARSGEAYGGSQGSAGSSGSRSGISADEGFLAFARTQHARSEASRAARAQQAAGR